MTVDLLRSALATAEHHHNGLRELRDQLKASALGGAAPWDAEAAAGELVRTLRYRLGEIEGARRLDMEIDDTAAALGITFEEDEEGEEADDPIVLPEWAQQAVLMMGGVSPMAMQMLASPLSFRFRKQVEPSPGCYEASWGWVHSRPSCRCAR